MDPKNWRWRRRSSEKTITTSDRDSELGQYDSSVNEKLASVLVDCHGKDELELAASCKMESEVQQLRHELDDALSQLAAANENSSRLENQLKERNEQLTALREDSNRMVDDAVFQTREKLVAKEKLIESLSRCKSQIEAEFNALMCRLDSIEKENSFLKYEFCILEKELTIRTDELEYHRQSADSSHRKHLDSLKKIVKLEGEIHQLRVFTQKRLPGPASTMKMKNEVKMLGRNRNPESSSTKKPTLCFKTSLRELEATRPSMELGKVDDIAGSRMSSSGSWANALISELENFRIEKMNPMEIDHLAIVSVPENGLRETTEISFDWLQVVLNAMTEQTQISNRSLLELFEDISIALGFMNQTESSDVKISGYLPWKSPSSKGEDDYHNSEFSKTVQKLARLVGSFTPRRTDYCVHVFQWKSSELSVIQANFLQACSDLLDEKYDLQTFVGELADALEWIMNSDSTTPKNASRDRIKRRINFTNSPNLDKNSSFVEENTSEPVETKLEKAEQCIVSLRLEVQELQEAKLEMDNQIETQKSVNVDLDTQLRMTQSKHSELLQKLSSLEIELEEKKRCCEDLEATCLEFQLQQESAVKETPKHPIAHSLNALASPWERSLFEKKSLMKRSSLRDRMLAEDDSVGTRNNECGRHNAISLSIVPRKKQSGIGFLRRLLLRRTKGSIKKSSFDKTTSLR